MKIKIAWEKMSIRKRITFSLRIGISIVILIVSILSLIDVLDSMYTNNFIIPLIGIVLTLMGIDEYHNNKGLAYFAFGAAAIIFVFALLIFWGI